MQLTRIETMKSLTIPRTIVNKLLSEAQKNPEMETCGLVSEKHGSPCNVYPVANVSGDKQQLFEMDPAQQIAAMKSMRDNNESLFAIYHSHPHAPAQPSATDIAQASYPDALYLIISLDTRGVLEMRGFYLRQNDIEAVELHI